MAAKLVSFGEIEIDGRRFTTMSSSRADGSGSAARDRRRSTALATVTPTVGRGGDSLVGCSAGDGTGASGQLPVMDEV